MPWLTSWPQRKFSQLRLNLSCLVQPSLKPIKVKLAGFTLGQFEPRWRSLDFWCKPFRSWMGNGEGRGTRTAFWANWGDSWNTIGDRAWYVNTDGKMYCKNDSIFYRQVTFDTNCSVDCYGTQTFYKSPVFIHGIELGEADIYGNGSKPERWEECGSLVEPSWKWKCEILGR